MKDRGRDGANDLWAGDETFSMLRFAFQVVTRCSSRGRPSFLAGPIAFTSPVAELTVRRKLCACRTDQSAAFHRVTALSQRLKEHVASVAVWGQKGDGLSQVCVLLKGRVTRRLVDALGRSTCPTQILFLLSHQGR